MKRILLVCLLLIATVNSYAQSGSRECLYHIKFYNWQWDYCKVIGYDTIPKYSMYTGEHIGDTILWDTSFKAYSPSALKLLIPFPPSFVGSSQELVVTSFDKTKKYEIEEFELSLFYDFDNYDCLELKMPKVAHWNVKQSIIYPKQLREIEKQITCDKANYSIEMETKLKGINEPLNAGSFDIKLVR